MRENGISIEASKEIEKRRFVLPIEYYNKR